MQEPQELHVYFRFLFYVAVTNSFSLSSYSPTTMPNSLQRLKGFHRQLADQLVGSYNTRNQLGRPRSRPMHPPPTLPSQLHLGPPPTHQSRTATHFPVCHDYKKQCLYFSQHHGEYGCSRVVWYCKDCPGHPTPCFTGSEGGSDCFRLWHQHFIVICPISYISHSFHFLFTTCHVCCCCLQMFTF